MPEIMSTCLPVILCINLHLSLGDNMSFGLWSGSRTLLQIFKKVNTSVSVMIRRLNDGIE